MATGRARTDGSGGNRRGRRASFGSLRKLSSGRWQVRYTGPDGREHRAPTTFETKGDAETFLATVRADIVRETWQAGAAKRIRPVTLDEYAERWLAARKVKGRPLAERTRAHYQHLLDRFLSPTFGSTPLAAITADDVAHWYDTAAVGTPTYQAHAYSLLRAILATAADPTKNNGRALIPFNPCGITGGGATSPARQTRPASLAELEAIATAMPERLRLMVLLAAWCALRFGELAELRRSDVDTKRGILHVRRGVVRAGGEVVIRKPKTGRERDVAIPPHLLPVIREHLLQHAEPGRDGLLFPATGGGNMAPSSLYRVYYPAREAAGRPDLRWHDLRHTGAVLAAQTGATLAELMSRLGHSTPTAAMRYQHAAAERDQEIARRLSAMVEGDQ